MLFLPNEKKRSRVSSILKILAANKPLTEPQLKNPKQSLSLKLVPPFNLRIETDKTFANKAFLSINHFAVEPLRT